ncbi:S-adenosylmethionine decarboxylase [Streptoalloteichus tenebrarius]|nr:hypothetical protein GCM10020241_07820 [Streptoalloteichus tenebrarius]
MLDGFLHAAAMAAAGITAGELTPMLVSWLSGVMPVPAESHLTVSTWPEHELAYVDLFTCRADTDPEEAVAPILAVLGGGTVHGQIGQLGPNGVAAPCRPERVSGDEPAPARLLPGRRGLGR